jgi:hypothetical protein
MSIMHENLKQMKIRDQIDAQFTDELRERNRWL